MSLLTIPYDQAKYQEALQFLSQHHTYRILIWEFGPTLLQTLNSKRESPILKRGLFASYTLASVVSVFTLARKSHYTYMFSNPILAMVAGVLFTLALDHYQRGKTAPQSLSETELVETLKKIETLPLYWWWPWGKTLKKEWEKGITPEERVRGLEYANYSTKKRLWYTLWTNITAHHICLVRDHYLHLTYPVKGEKSMASISSSIFPSRQGSTCTRSIKKFVKSKFGLFTDRWENKPTLEQVLENLGWDKSFLLDLDRSLQGVENQTKTITHHNNAFNYTLSKINQFIHQHTCIDNNLEKVAVISDLVSSLEQIHIVAKKALLIREQEKNKEITLLPLAVYQLFNNVPLKKIQDKLSRDSHLLLSSQIHAQTVWEEEVRQGRDIYLQKAQEILNQSRYLLSQGIEAQSTEIDRLKKECYDHTSTYQTLYETWIQRLKTMQNLSCEKRLTKTSSKYTTQLDTLLDEMQQGAKILRQAGKTNLLETGRSELVQPILNYSFLIHLYLDTCTRLKEIDASFSLKYFIDDRCSLHTNSNSFLEKQDLSLHALLKEAHKRYTECYNLRDMKHLKEILEQSAEVLNQSWQPEASSVQKEIDHVFDEATFLQQTDSDAPTFCTHYTPIMQRLFISEEGTMTLQKALDQCPGMGYLPLFLDHSLGEVRSGEKTLEEHNIYFHAKVKEIVRLSLQTHPDRQGSHFQQCLINDLTTALRQIHAYFSIHKSKTNNRFAYRLFLDMPLKDLLEGGDAIDLNVLILITLSDLTYQEGEILMQGRNLYLNGAKGRLERLKKAPSTKEKKELLEEEIQAYHTYKELYRTEWIEKIKEFQKEITSFSAREERLSILNKTFKQSETQYEILTQENLHRAIDYGDPLFIQPMVLIHHFLIFYTTLFPLPNPQETPVMEESCLPPYKTFFKELKTAFHRLGKALQSQEVDQEAIKALNAQLHQQIAHGEHLLYKTFTIKETLIEKENRKTREMSEWFEEQSKRYEEIQQEIKAVKQEKNAAEQEKNAVEQEKNAAEQEKNAAEQKAYATNQFMCQLIGLEGPLQKIVHQESDTIIKQVCQLPKTKIEPALEKIFQKIQTNKEEILRKTQLSRQVIEEWIQNDLQLII